MVLICYAWLNQVLQWTYKVKGELRQQLHWSLVHASAITLSKHERCAEW
jgi:hypothetical protein